MDDATRRQGTWEISPLRVSLQRFKDALRGQELDIGWGEPDYTAGWFRHEALLRPEFANRVVSRIRGEYDFGEIAGVFAFGYSLNLPLRLAGFLFASERRVPRLAANVALLDRKWLNRLRLLEPRAVVLESDPEADAPGFETVATLDELTDVLFAEAARLASPLADAWSTRQRIARTNAWAAIIDALAYGFMDAGNAGLGLDAAWEDWERAITGRPLPVRRRPRRHRFAVDGEPVDLLVRAHCCLWHTLPQARDTEDRYCTTCYIPGDDYRVARMTAYRRQQAAAGTAAATESKR